MFPQIHAPHTGASASAGMGNLDHTRAQHAAFSAARRLNMARSMSGRVGAPAPAAGGPDFRQHVSARVGGASVPEIHGAIDALTAAKQFTPLQGAALKVHNGPLQGPAGMQTIHKIASAVTQRRSMAAQMPRVASVPSVPIGGTQGPIAGGGMPAGMGQ